MNTNIVGTLCSLIYISAILLAASLLKYFHILSGDGPRKMIHISVSGWWIIAGYFYDSPVWAGLVPAAFIVINLCSLRFNLISAMERPLGEHSYGTVYYAVSLTILTLLCFSGISSIYIGALGVFTMAFGDGFAAILGKRFGGSKYYSWGSVKSYFGSAVMFFLSFIISSIVLLLHTSEYHILPVLCVAAAAALLEAGAPPGLDNLTVPLGVSGLYYLLISSNSWPNSAIYGIVFSAFVAYFVYKKGMLTYNGGIAAFFTAGLFYLWGGGGMWLLLMLFFFSAGMIGKINKRIMRQVREEASRKTGARDAIQVLANSVPALICLGLYEYNGRDFYLLSAICALAAATADTWASEIGTLSRTAPRSILTGKIVPRGLSGGVTILGFVASIGGAVLIGSAATLFYFFSTLTPNLVGIFGVVVLTGFLGALFDSLLGASVQAKFQCSVCHIYTEKYSHHGQNSRLVAGIRWVDNDVVNLLSGILTVVLVFLCFRWFL